MPYEIILFNTKRLSGSMSGAHFFGEVEVIMRRKKQAIFSPSSSNLSLSQGGATVPAVTLPKFVDSKQAAEFLGISESFLRKLVCTGRLKAYRLKSVKRLRFREDELLGEVVER